VKQETRIIVVLVVALVVTGVALWYAAGLFGRKLGDQAYIGVLKGELRQLAAGEATFFRENLLYTTEVARVWTPRMESRGATLEILGADADGFVAVGRSEYWPRGRCVIAVGHFAGDSLKSGEPECYWE
jgi:hypothetical protein